MLLTAEAMVDTKVLEAAKAKGREVSGDSFLLGGVSFRLAA